MNNKIFLVFSLLFSILLISACSTDDPASSDEETFKIKLENQNSPDSIQDWTSREFKRLVEEYTDGRMEVEIYNNGQLGDIPSTMQALQNGSLAMTQGSASNFGSLAPSLNYLNLPYLFTSSEEAESAIFNLWDKNNEILTSEAGMRVMIWTANGFRNLTTSEDHPIRTLEDVKGVKIRVPGNPISADTFSAFGAAPQVMAYGDVFNALQQGVINGQENNIVPLVTQKYYEAGQKYVTDIQWQFALSGFVMSEQIFQSFPQDIQDALTRAGKEATEAVIARFKDQKAGMVSDMEAEGVEFLGQPEDYQEWVDAGRSVWPNAYEDIGDGDKQKGEELVNEMLEIIQE